MKAKSIILSAVFVLALFGLSAVRAQPLQGAWDQLQHSAGNNGASMGDPMDPRLIIARIVQLALTFVATILFALCVYAGYQWMTAGGNDETIAKSKKTIVNSTIGLAIILSSYGITIVITNLAMGRDLATRTSSGATLDTPIRNSICNSQSSWVNWACR